MTTRARLNKSAVDRVVGGVCGGAGAALGVNAWWVRVAYAALVVAQPAFGILLYLLLWIVFPAQGLNDLAPLNAAPKVPRPEAALLIGALTILIGIAALVLALPATSRADLVVPLLLLLISFALLLRQLRRA